MYKFIGEFSDLENLGFICNKDHNYYFLPKRRTDNKYYNPINVDIKTRRVEYTDSHDLELIRNWIVKIV